MVDSVTKSSDANIHLYLILKTESASLKEIVQLNKIWKNERPWHELIFTYIFCSTILRFSGELNVHAVIQLNWKCLVYNYLDCCVTFTKRMLGMLYYAVFPPS